MVGAKEASPYLFVERLRADSDMSLSFDMEEKTHHDMGRMETINVEAKVCLGLETMVIAGTRMMVEEHVSLFAYFSGGSNTASEPQAFFPLAPMMW